MMLLLELPSHYYLIKLYYLLPYQEFPIMLIHHSVKIWLAVQHSVKSTESWLDDIGKYWEGNFEQPALLSHCLNVESHNNTGSALGVFQFFFWWVTTTSRGVRGDSILYKAIRDALKPKSSVSISVIYQLKSSLKAIILNYQPPPKVFC